VSHVIRLLDEQGRGMFAFDPRTDADEVLRAVAWAHPDGQAICGTPRGACPMIGDDRRTRTAYCCDCHAIAWAALCEARRRGMT
jgi:hypothetical protein